jgi:hypothetical protein
MGDECEILLYELDSFSPVLGVCSGEDKSDGRWTIYRELAA